MLKEIEGKLLNDLKSEGNPEIFICDLELLRLLYIWNEEGEINDDPSKLVDLIYAFLSENALNFSNIDGYLGIFWFFNCLASLELYNDEHQFLPQLQDAIDSSLSEDMSICNLDPLYGIPAKAFIYKESNNTNKLNEIVQFIKHTEEAINTKEVFEKSFKKDDWLSYAHGWPGVVTVLCQVYPLISASNRIWLKEFLQKIGDLIVKESKNQYLAHQNSLISNKKIPPHPERLAWCYGDFGLALMFKELNKLGIYEGAEVQMYYFLNRTLERNIDNAYLNKADDFIDIGICHGLSGLYYLNLHFAEHLHDKKFYEKALYWWSVIEKEYEKNNDFRTIVKESGKYISYDFNNFLEGKLGLALILQSLRTTSILPWQHLLMIF